MPTNGTLNFRRTIPALQRRLKAIGAYLPNG